MKIFRVSVVVLVSFLCAGCGSDSQGPVQITGRFRFAGLVCGGSQVPIIGYDEWIQITEKQIVSVSGTTTCESTSTSAYALSGSTATVSASNSTCDPDPCTMLFTVGPNLVTVPCGGTSSGGTYQVEASGDVLKASMTISGIVCTGSYVRQ